MPDPKRRPSAVLGRQVKEWRNRRKLSAQDLANRAAEIGATSLTRAAISKIEVGQRGVSLDEWLQLAHALAVPPPLLFLDLHSGEDIEIADKVVIHPWLAWEWVTGDEAPVMSDRTVSRAAEFTDAKHVIELYRLERRAADAVTRAEHAIRVAEYADDQRALSVARTQHAEALRELSRSLDEMLNNDVTPPALPKEWLVAMAALRFSAPPMPAWPPMRDISDPFGDATKSLFEDQPRPPDGPPAGESEAE